ncbi:RNA polymerase sigma factor ShbA [Thermocrispum agreste]|nr:MAG: RNA polymerase sigma factor ShbA [Thermocrispum agreste]
MPARGERRQAAPPSRGQAGRSEQASRPQQASRAEQATPDPYAELVEAAKAGDQWAIERLIAQLRPLIVRYCRARIGRSVSTFASADDVAQDVCIAVLTSLRSYRSTGASFLGFVYGIATHKIMDFHRKYSRERSTPVADIPDVVTTAAEPERRLLHDELGQQVGALLAELSDTQRDVLTLRLVVGLSVAETAQATSMSLGAVRVCQHRALAKLRKLLADRQVTAQV